MSAAQPAAAAATSSSRAPFKQRPRHFWEGPDPADDSDEDKQGAEHFSPVARLYRHALESVFGFLELSDLSRMLSVSRSWASAVLSMGSLNAGLVLSEPLPVLIAASPLARHVSKIGEWVNNCLPELASSDLFILSRHLGSLASLSCVIQLPQPSRLFFGPSLTILWLQLKGETEHASSFNHAIVTISHLTKLTALTLELPGFFPALTFAPLASSTQLRDLKLVTPSWEQPTPQHLDQLRALQHLRKMDLPALDAANLALLLRIPHSLQWQEIHQLDRVNDTVAAALSTLPTLTKLQTFRCGSAAFLPALTRLRNLDLCMANSVHLAAAIVTGLGCCSQLTDLTLEAADVTAKHMSQIVSHLPLLSSLTLTCDALESLSFLSECPHLAHSLHSLRLQYCANALHSTDLEHILSLKNLTSLNLHRAFVEPLDACTQHLLTPPSIALPALSKFTYRR